MFYPHLKLADGKIVIPTHQDGTRVDMDLSEQGILEFSRIIEKTMAELAPSLGLKVEGASPPPPPPEKKRKSILQLISKY